MTNLSHRAAFSLFACALIACGGSSGGGNPGDGNINGGNPDAGIQYLLSVSRVGTGSGQVTSSQSAGIDCGSTCSVSLEAGSSVTLSAAANADSDFMGWSGSCSGTGACTLAMDAAKTVTARFSLSRVVFQSSRKLDGTDAQNANRTLNIWRANSDGSGLTPITRATAPWAGGFDPQWSPDGSQVVFWSHRNVDGSDAANPNLTCNIWRVNTDGSGLTPLTSATAGGAYSYDPQWSPDGSKVIFNSSRKLDGSDAPNANNIVNIWRVNADGTGLRLITNTTANGAGSSLRTFGP
jgi:hypothetical protein